MIRRALWLSTLLLLLAACSPVDTTPSATQTSRPAPTATATPTTPSTPLPASPIPAPTMSAPPAYTADALPPAALFATAWSDRSPYQASLLPFAYGLLDAPTPWPVYHIDLTIAADLQRVSGLQEVLFTNDTNGDVDQLVMRSYVPLLGGSLNLTALTVNGAPVAPRFDDSKSVLTVALPAPLRHGQQLVVGLAYTVTLPTIAGANYGILLAGADSEPLALAHVFPVLALADNGIWDARLPAPYGDVLHAATALFRVRVAAPTGLTLAASGTAVDYEERNGLGVTEFVAGPVRDFFLAGGKNLAAETVLQDGVAVSSYAAPDVAPTAARNAADAAAALALFSELLGKYPYRELDLIATPTQALGVEYPGIVVIADRLYYGNAATTPWLESTVAHEVAHQWFYGLVGSDQLGAPWLDESLTQYMTLRYYRERYGPAGAAGFQQSLIERWDRVGNAPIPIGQAVSAYTPAEYGAIIYGRGALFFLALEEALGPLAFDAFLSDYVSAQWLRIGDRNDLEAAAEAACGCTLDALFAAWVDDGS